MTRWIEARKWMHVRSLKPIPVIYNRDEISIAVHIRTGDIEPNRGTPEEFFHTLLTQYLVPILGDLPYKIYYFSEGLDSTKFAKLLSVPNHIQKTNQDMGAYETYQHLIESDILIMSRSGYSQFAAIFSHRPLIISPPSRESFPLRFEPIGSIGATLKGNIESQDVIRIRKFRDRWIRSQEIKAQIKYLEEQSSS